MSKSNRTFKNILIQPSAQLLFLRPFALLLGFLALTFIAVFILIAARLENEITRLQDVEPRVVSYLQATIETLWKDLLIGGVAVGVVGLTLAVIYSHRIFGAAFAINNQIDRLIAGDCDHQLTLRANDQLKETADKLNLLSKKMRAHAR